MPIEGLEESKEETAQFEAMLNEQPLPEATPEPAPAAEPVAEKAPEPAKVATPAPEPEKPPTRLVPQQALHEEREKRKELERWRDEVVRRMREAAPPAEMPDETVDPIGALSWMKAEIAKEKAAKEEATRQQAYLQDLGSKISARINAYAKDHPEYQEQVTFLRQFRVRELMEGLDYTQEQAIAQAQNEELFLGKMAVDNDKDPGIIVNNLAKVRGWQPKSAETTKTPADEVAIPTVDLEAERKIARLQKGQKAAISPSHAGGGAPQAEMTLEHLNSLTGAAFDTAWEKHAKRLMGG